MILHLFSFNNNFHGLILRASCVDNQIRSRLRAFLLDTPHFSSRIIIIVTIRRKDERFRVRKLQDSRKILVHNFVLAYFPDPRSRDRDSGIRERYKNPGKRPKGRE